MKTTIDVGYEYKPNWLSIVFWFLIGLMLPGILARAEGYVPTERHVRAAETGDDCGIYRRLVKRASDEIEEGQSQLLFLKQTLKKRRADLEECARNQGIREVRGDEVETLMAELCPTVYEAWLSPGYRVQLVRQDVQAARQAVETLQSQIRWSCGSLPPVASLPVSH